jgi:hypothetical protein
MKDAKGLAVGFAGWAKENPELVKSLGLVAGAIAAIGVISGVVAAVMMVNPIVAIVTGYRPLRGLPALRVTGTAIKAWFVEHLGRARGSVRPHSSIAFSRRSSVRPGWSIENWEPHQGHSSSSLWDGGDQLVHDGDGLDPRARSSGSARRSRASRYR